MTSGYLAKMDTQAPQISKKRKFVVDGVFFTELNEVLTRELAEDGYFGVEISESVFSDCSSQNWWFSLFLFDPLNLYNFVLLDHILLETTGLANPAPLASVLWLDDQLESDVRLDSIITVVDAKNLQYHQPKPNPESFSFPEAYLQIAFADVIILNKVDLISKDDSGVALEELEKDIRDVNSLANIIHSHAAHLEALLEENKSLTTKGLHDGEVRTLCICDAQQIDLDKIDYSLSWITKVLICLVDNRFVYGLSSFGIKKYGMDVYRCKGILRVRNSDELHILQFPDHKRSPELKFPA
ncbi:hypothetical protein FXO37_09377 [Capsicum annuum]|nr:hypothetical protein FXO37_09377 [Capsicum annuum]